MGRPMWCGLESLAHNWEFAHSLPPVTERLHSPAKYSVVSRLTFTSVFSCGKVEFAAG